MKALSVRQPWASLIASGKKTIEIRSRRTSHRGPLLICASKHGNAGDGLPRAVAICIVRVIDCRPLSPSEDERAAHFRGRESDFAWVLDEATPVEPFPIRGQLGVFEAMLPGGQSQKLPPSLF